MKQRVSYGVYVGDDLVAKGSHDFLMGIFGAHAYNYADKKTLFKGMYSFRKLGKFDGNEIVNRSLIGTSILDENLTNAVNRMRIDGNLFARDPEIYRSVLEENGIQFTYKPCSDGIGYKLERI